MIDPTADIDTSVDACLIYIQVKTSYQEFSKNYQEQNQLFL